VIPFIALSADTIKLNLEKERKKAAGVESGGGKERAWYGSRLDGVGPFFANLFARDNQPMVLSACK
jgi:hypothetical protein